MYTTDIKYEHSVSPLRYSTSPFTVKLTCLQVQNSKIICLSNKETSSLPIPDQAIVQHSGFIPLTTKPNSYRVPSRPTTRSMTTNAHISLNFDDFSQILLGFGVSDYSTILCEIEQAITSSSSKGKGVVEVKIWKIITSVYQIDHVTEKSVIESLLMKRSVRVFKYDSKAAKEEEDDNECAICMEDYTQGSLMAKLACGHYFHGGCINKWLHINHHCPMCRLSISDE